MLFAPDDEVGYFEALRSGQFDAKEVCSKLDAAKCNATVEADKTMIMEQITAEVGLKRYNDQLRHFLEQQYRLVAMAARDASVMITRLVRRRKAIYSRGIDAGKRSCSMRPKVCASCTCSNRRWCIMISSQ